MSVIVFLIKLIVILAVVIGIYDQGFNDAIDEMNKENKDD